MTALPPHQPSTGRRPFAPKYAHPVWGWILTILGGMYFLSSFTALSAVSRPGSIGAAISGFIMLLLFGGGLLLWGIYLLRGRGDSPRAAARKAAAGRRAGIAPEVHGAQAASSIAAAVAGLTAAVGAGAQVVALRNLDATVRGIYPHDADARIRDAIDSAGVDLSATNSPLLGIVRVPSGTTFAPMEIYRDYVILGQQAHDYDESTTATVFTDGQIQVTSVAVTQRNGRQKIVNQEIDRRTASFRISSHSWSISPSIAPDDANEARRLAGQITAHAASLKPKAVSAADLQQMVDTILNNTGEPPATRIQRLDELRYQRLISDDDFKQASAKILGI